MSDRKSKGRRKRGSRKSEEETRFERDLEDWESGAVDPYEHAEEDPIVVTESEEFLEAPDDVVLRSVEALKSESWFLRVSQHIKEIAIGNARTKGGTKRGQQQTEEAERKLEWIQGEYNRLRAMHPVDGKLDLVKRALISWKESHGYVSDAEKGQITESVIKKMSRKITD